MESAESFLIQMMKPEMGLSNVGTCPLAVPVMWKRAAADRASTGSLGMSVYSLQTPPGAAASGTGPVTTASFHAKGVEMSSRQ